MLWITRSRKEVRLVPSIIRALNADERCRMKIKKLPNVLALHLKRFKYEESLQRHVKLNYRVAFPLDLRLFNTADGVGDPDRLYELWAIIVHIGLYVLSSFSRTNDD